MVIDWDKITFSCMVCGAERPNPRIDVAYRPLKGYEDRFPDGTRVNVRYCNDNAECIATAHAEGPWPTTS